ncbi:SDR family NAD(P)-dependent oxidoreductase [Paraburkholderia fungorum]|uniref:SDR family NAD(P)-dependent oxidoreductase n=1 Tax=Paraburkholderia fungorum TaxID=134537 RepID=UPI0038B8E143
MSELNPLQRAVLVTQKLRARVDELEAARNEPIAIVGMACRFPGRADNPEAYWQLLREGVDAVGEVPPDRWDWREHYSENAAAPGKTYARYGAFLQNIDEFDAAFFGIAPREARALDPQQRLVLELGWEAMERAGYASGKMRGSITGVYLGVTTADYAHKTLSSGNLEGVDAYNLLGNARAVAAGRLAFVCGFQGPVMQLDTTCSSSLLAVHLAIQGLRQRECEIALAGGVNVMLWPGGAIGFSRLNALARDGRCKAFDAGADGYVRGEGGGIVVLRRLSDALRDDDHIVAVIRGSAVNHDGRSSGLTVPNGLAQEAVIRQALKNAQLEPEQIGYVEMHGTGTSLGDPIEVNALARALPTRRAARQLVRIGSAKSNIGHLEAAAGIASLIKAALVVEQGEIPPQLHFRTPNPEISWGEIPIEVPLALTPWRSQDAPRRAGVSAFGMSGTNVHVVLEQPPAPREGAGERAGSHMLHLSARSDAALRALSGQLGHFLLTHPDTSLHDLCFTVNTGRYPFEKKIAIHAQNITELKAQLDSFADGGSIASSLPETSNVQDSSKGRKLVLPTYPFERKRHWISALKPSSVPHEMRDDEVRAWLYGIAWHEQALTHTAAENFPSIQTLEPEICRVRRTALAEPDALAFPAVLAALEARSLGYVRAAFDRLGWSADQQPGLLSSYRRLVARMWEMLAENAENAQVDAQPPACAEANLLAVCGPRLADVLCGACNPLDLLFPDGDDSAVRALYEYSPSARALNALIVTSIKMLMQSGAPLRILEVGGGTASTTAELVPMLARRPDAVACQYVFTDISPAFTARASDRFNSFGFFTTHLLDIERDPSAQGFVDQRFDVIVASNVIHATRDIEVSLRYLRGLLAPGGYLLLGEGTRPLRWLDLTFGLTVGWWHFTDTALRNHALMSPDAWRSVLGRQGFPEREVYVLPELSAQSLIVARTESTTQASEQAAAGFDRDAIYRVPQRHAGGTPFEQVWQSCGDVLALAQSLVAQSPEAATRLWIVSRGGLMQAPLRGMRKSIALENPELRPTLIEIDAQYEGDIEALIRAELDNAGTEEEIAYRNGRRSVARLVPLKAVPVSLPAVRSDASYLIAGGFGDLGLLVAEWLAGHGATHITLLGRKNPSPAAQARVDALTQRGVDMLAILGDVADVETVAHAVAQTCLAGKPLRGVFHSAGVLDDAMLTRQSKQTFERVMAAKVNGAWNLHEQTRAIPLDFFVLFSSIASVIGSPGQVNHAAASAFLDGLAQTRAAEGLPALSINWSTWSGVGAAARIHADEQMMKRGVRPISPPHGLRALDILMGEGHSQVAVAPIDWRKFTSRSRALPFLSELLTARSALPASETDTARSTRVTASLDRESLREHIRGELAAVLDFASPEEVRPDMGFFDLGLDSLTSVELRNRLNRHLGVALPGTLALDYPTLDALTDHIFSKLTPASAASGAPEAPVVRATGCDGYEPIAIIGMACRFPGANDLESFWSLLEKGGDVIRDVPPDRWSLNRYFDSNPDAPGRISTRYGGFLDDIQGFDAELFHISRREAESLDPQQRIYLEVCWEALERAGIAPDRLTGTATGVFVGASAHDYLQMLLSRGGEAIDQYVGSGNAACMIAGRVAYTFGFQGPAISLDTACSSSLVALHQACQSLRSGECEMALAGGVNVVLIPEVSINFSKAGMLAPDGRCKAFDAGADGYVRSEGCGVVVLKRLSHAQRDHDTVLALIRGSAINHDGRSSGLTVPNGPAQQKVIRAAQTLAAIAPGDIDYVEAHGTGTALGDPIEMESLSEVFRDGRTSDRPLLIGAVKTNLGHLEAAAGMAGLIKTVLAFQHEAIPRHLHFESPNPHLPSPQWFPYRIPQALTAWPRASRLRRAGLNAFGFSGTNAHIVLEEAPDDIWRIAETGVSPIAAPRAHLLTISARTPETLRNLAVAYTRRLESLSEAHFADFAYSSTVARAQMRFRIAVTASSPREAAQKISQALREDRYEKDVSVEGTTSCCSGPRHRVDLPIYPFEHKRYWIDTPAAGESIPAWADLLYRIEWRPTTAAVARESHKRHWIFASAGDSIGTLLAAVQQAAADGAGKQIWIASQGAVATGHEKHDRLRIDQAPVWGVARVLSREHPELFGGIADIETEAADLTASPLLETAPPGFSAWRAGQFYTPHLIALPWTEGTPRARISAQASYLVTGGLGAVGSQVAKWLAQRGARRLILAGRTVRAEAVHRLRADMPKDVELVLVTADVANASDVRRLLEQSHSDMWPLRGIIHAAGITDDGLLLQQTAERFERAMEAKAKGAWHLHQQTLAQPLDFFVLFSAGAALFGAPGQASYAAANTYLDTLAHYRHALGLPAVSIDWGLWAVGGMAARDRGYIDRLASNGIRSMESHESLAILEHVLISTTPQVLAMDVDWDRFVLHWPTTGAPIVLDDVLSRSADMSGRNEGKATGIGVRLASVSPQQAEAVLGERVAVLVSQVLRRDEPSRIDSEQGFSDMGLDSMLALELKNRLEAEFEISLSATIALEFSTVASLTRYVAGRVLADATPLAEPRSPVPLSKSVAVEETVDLDALSDGEVTALLMQKLASLSGPSHDR